MMSEGVASTSFARVMMSEGVGDVGGDGESDGDLEEEEELHWRRFFGGDWGRLVVPFCKRSNRRRSVWPRPRCFEPRAVGVDVSVPRCEEDVEIAALPRSCGRHGGRGLASWASSWSRAFLLETAGATAFAGGPDGASPSIRPVRCWTRLRAAGAGAEGLAAMCALRHGMEAQRWVAAV